MDICLDLASQERTFFFYRWRVKKKNLDPKKVVLLGCKKNKACANQARQSGEVFSSYDIFAVIFPSHSDRLTLKLRSRRDNLFGALYKFSCLVLRYSK